MRAVMLRTALLLAALVLVPSGCAAESRLQRNGRRRGMMARAARAATAAEGEAAEGEAAAAAAAGPFGPVAVMAQEEQDGGEKSNAGPTPTDAASATAASAFSSSSSATASAGGGGGSASDAAVGDLDNAAADANANDRAAARSARATGNLVPPHPECEVGPWSDWSECSLACTPSTGGRGLESRSRIVVDDHGSLCPNVIETRTCEPAACPVNCRVSNWTEWSGCARPCEDPGSESRTREVVSDSVHGGDECPALSEERPCNAAPCPKPVPDCATAALKNCSSNGACTMQGCQCYPGYVGADCAQVLERDCKNDCSGHGKCRTADSQCVCDEGYDGDDCSEGHCPRDCSGHGTCMTEPQLYCQCSFGYVGMDCASKICPNDCSGHGYCEASGTCKCHHGYSSADCSSGECPNDCSGNGVCVDGRCECNLGFIGKGCAERHCGSECIHGECVHDECVCFKNYVGASCARKICTDGETCNGHGSCTVDQRCSCENGFIGEFCAERPCPDNCNSHGVCLSGLCKCDFPYEGATCAAKGCDHKCSQHGRCVDGTCVCHPGYSGALCLKVKCPRDCSGHGTCGNDGTCQCLGGFAGADCTLPRCPNDCFGHGRCDGSGEGGRGKCHCEEQYGASDCSMTLAMAPDCVHGYSVDESCFCEEGWTGDMCDEKVCAKSLDNGLFCSGHGICNPKNGTCICETGFGGPVCRSMKGPDAEPLEICPNDCSGKGDCTASGCDCVQGYRGVACGHQVCPFNCSNHGICAHGKCHCDKGYDGEACAVPICEGKCHGRGRCVSPGKCACDELVWTGDACEKTICGAGCDAERGVCNLDKTCTCLTGFGGADCSCSVTSPASWNGEQNKAGVGTAAQPEACSGHGVCAGRQCFCDSKHHWGGLDCSEKLCPNECSAHGECVDGACKCVLGFSGDDCSETSCPADCSGHGACMDGMSEMGGKACVCYGGWGGPAADCAEKVCEYNCNNNGLCKNGTCFCSGTWQGEFCDTPACEPECAHGACHEGKCECEENWWGEACDRRTCQHGAWSATTSSVDAAFPGCKCDLGWSGPACNTTEHCLPGTCANGGYCASDANCICANGFTGANCEQVVCPNKCSGHGECNAAEFRCDCAAGYDGFVCEVETSFERAADVLRSLRGV